MKIHEAKINKLRAASALTSVFFLFAENFLEVLPPRADSPYDQENAPENPSHLVAAKIFCPSALQW